MKKVILFALASILSIGIANANDGKRLLQFGFHGGLTSNESFEHATNDVAGTFEAASSYYAGLALRLNIPILPIYVQPELDYTWNHYTNDSFEEEHSKAVFNTLRAPVLVGVGIGGKALKVRVNAGPVFDFGKVGNKNFAGWDEFGATFDKSTISWTAGVGLDISKLNIDFRFNGEFKDQSVHLDNAFDKINDKATNWQLSIGLMF